MSQAVLAHWCARSAACSTPAPSTETDGLPSSAVSDLSGAPAPAPAPAHGDIGTPPATIDPRDDVAAAVSHAGRAEPVVVPAISTLASTRATPPPSKDLDLDLARALLIDDCYSLSIGNGAVGDPSSEHDAQAQWFAPDDDEQTAMPAFEVVDEPEDEAEESPARAQHLDDSDHTAGVVKLLPCSTEFEMDFMPSTEEGEGGGDYGIVDGSIGSTVVADGPSSSARRGADGELGSSGSDSDSRDDSDGDVHDDDDWVIQCPGLEWEEQKAKWLFTAPSSELRIFPHHIPIPASESSRSMLDTCDHVAELASGADAGDIRPLITEGRAESCAQSRFVLLSLSIKWRLFAGSDWVATDEAPVAPSQSVGQMEEGPPRSSTFAPARDGGAESSTESRSDILDALLENYHGHPTAADAAPAQLRAQQHSRTPVGVDVPSRLAQPSRKTDRLVEVYLKQIQARADVYALGPTWQLAWGALCAVHDFSISQSISQMRLQKTLSYWRSDKQHPRENHRQMARLHVASVTGGGARAGVGSGTKRGRVSSKAQQRQQQRIKAQLLPLRCHLRHDVLQFVGDFFAAVNQATENEGASGDRADRPVSNTTSVRSSNAPCVERFTLQSCRMRLDYCGKPFELKLLQDGSYAEILNLFPLEGVELTLGRVHATDSCGASDLVDTVLQSWVRDISSNQLHKFVAGTAPLRSLSTIGSGVADLVILPVQHYRRDGRVLRGLRKGTAALVSSVTLETLTTSHRVAKYVARTLDDIVTDDKVPHSAGNVPRSEVQQPESVHEGLEHARDALSRGVHTAVHTIVAIPIEEYKRSGPAGGMKSVIRALPIAVLRPVIGATEAVSHTLIGVRNTIAPAMRDEEDLSAVDF